MGSTRRKVTETFKQWIIGFLAVLCMLQIDGGLFVEECQAADISFVILSKYSATMNIGHKFYLVALTSNGKKPTFKSSDTKVASVNTYGLITAKKGGTANVTVKIKDTEAVCKVKVNPTVISIDKTSLSIENGETTRISASASNGAKLTYKVNKKSIATVNEKGYVTGVKPGEAVITIQADGYSKTCQIKVRQPVVSLGKSSITLYRGQSYPLSVKVSSKIQPTFKSNKKSVAVVDDYGNITAVKNGTAIITVKVDGVSKSCIVTVKKPSITFDVYEVTMQTGKTYTLKTKVSSGNKPEYSSSNTAVATVNSSGVIKATGKGNAYIYAYEDGTKVKCKIIVK